MKLPKGAGVEMAREYYGRQHPIRCALFGHKISGILVNCSKVECLRCGGQWPFGSMGRYQSLYEWLILWPIAPIRRQISIWKTDRWFKKNMPNTDWI